MSENEQLANRSSEEVQHSLLEQIEESHAPIQALSDEELEATSGSVNVSAIGRFVGEHKPLVAGSVAMTGVVATVVWTVTTK